MVALVNNKSAPRNRTGVNLIGIEEVDEFGGGGCCFLRRNKTDIVSGSSGCNLMRTVINSADQCQRNRKTYPLQNIKTIPLGSHQSLVRLDEFGQRLIRSPTIHMLIQSTTYDHHRLLGGLERLEEIALAGGQSRNSSNVRPQVLVLVRCVNLFANESDLEVAVEI